jgi:hypothetical protein
LNRDEKKIREEKQEEQVVVEEEKPKEQQPEVQQEAENTENKEGQQEDGWRRKKGKFAPEEEKKEDLLERPENALSVHEYRELLKQKNQALGTKTVNVVKANETEAQPRVRDDSEFILGSGEQKKAKTAKPKEKKTDAKELVVEIKTEDVGARRFDNRDNRGPYQGGRGKKEEKFYYNPEEFPEL